MKFETRAIRTQIEQSSQKEHSVPLYLTSSFTFDSSEEGAAIFSGDIDANLYSRFSNPNTDELISKLCQMENCEQGVATASGMAAVYTSLVSHLKSGDHVVSSASIFGNSKYILSTLLPDFGIETSFVNIDNDAFEAAIRPNTKMVFIETPSNPTLQILDLDFLGSLCAQKGILFVVDNCFATPYLQQPAKYGADLVIHSATKYIDGQGRVLGGAILGKKEYVQKSYDFIRRTGASLSPFNAWVLSKSLETLSIRMEKHCSNALTIANYLSEHQEVSSVCYPHLESHPDYTLAKKQMLLGGGLVGCELKGGATRAMAFQNSLHLFSLTANLGDTRSIVTNPASTTHSKLSEAERLEAGISNNYIRFSVGLEHPDDLIQDIEQALEKTK